MTRFFKAMRYLVASYRVSFTKSGIGELAREEIRDKYIPVLLKRQKKSRSKAEKATLQERIDEFLSYTDYNKKGNWWDKVAYTASRNFEGTFRRFGLEVEDALQDIAIDLYQAGDLFTKYVQPDDEDAIDQMTKIFGSIVNRRVKNEARNLLTKEKYRQDVTMMDTGEEEGLPELDAIAPREETNIDKETMREYAREMAVFLSKRLTDFEQEVFYAWMQAVNKKGDASKVRIETDVMPVLEKKGIKGGKSSVFNAWKKIRQLVVVFFEKEIGLRIPERTKNKLKVSSANSRYKIARWVLQPLLKR